MIKPLRKHCDDEWRGMFFFDRQLARFRTADSISCQVGFTCEDDRQTTGNCYPGNNPALSRGCY